MWFVHIFDPYTTPKHHVDVFKTERGARNRINKLKAKESYTIFGEYNEKFRCVLLSHEEPIGIKLEKLHLPY